MRPLVFLIVLLSFGSFFFSNNVLPYSNRKARTLLYDIRRKRPELNIPSGSFYNGIDGFSIKISSKDPETNRLNKVIIYDHRSSQGNTSVVYADSGYMRITPDETGLILTLYSGFSYLDIEEKELPIDQKRFPFRRDVFDEQTLLIRLAGFDLDRSGMDLFKTNSAMLNISELTYYIDSLDIKYSNRQASFAQDLIENQIKSFGTRPEEAAPDEEKPQLEDNVGSITKDSATIATDTLIKAIPTSIDIWAILDTSSTAIKQKILSRAIESVKTNEQFIAVKQEALYHEMKSLRRYQIDWHKKFTLSFACLVFFFIGAPLGAIIRKGGLGMPAVISVLFFVIYYVITLTGEKFARESIMTPFTGMWLASFILMPVGIFLTYKATTDSAIMNSESYSDAIKKIRTFFTRFILSEPIEPDSKEEIS